uniref:ISXO2-like transposase domain-containing protein n=1 Tax=Trichuris muris TaxID=70415 RepID=A0A5S6QVU6_TRIMR
MLPEQGEPPRPPTEPSRLLNQFARRLAPRVTLWKLTPGRSGRCPTWRCRADGCREEVSIRKGTWFDGPRRRTPLETAVLFTYFWCRQMNSVKNCEHELGMCKSTALTWNHWMRQLATVAASADAVRIGGEGLTVEVDEKLLSKRKYNVGRLLPNRRALCRARCRPFERHTHGAHREARPPKEHNHDGSLEDLFQTLQVTGVHTQNIESLWAQLKRSMKLPCGMHRSMLKWHLGEQVWRRRCRGQEPIEQLLNGIATLYPPS